MEFENLISELHGLTDELLNSNKDVSLKVGGYSMYPSLKPGDQVTLRKLNVDEYRVGDIVVFKKANRWIAHRIKEILLIKEEKHFVTQGDSNRKKDEAIHSGNIIGKVISRNRNGIIKNYIGQTNYREILVFRFIINFWVKILIMRKKSARHISGINENLSFLTQRSKKSFRINIVLSLLIGILPLLIIYLVKWLVDAITKFKEFSKIDFENSMVLYIIGFIALAFLLQSVLSIIYNLKREKLSKSVTKFVYGLLHEKHATIDIEYLEDVSQQNKIHRAIQEAGFRPNKIISQYLTLIQSLGSWVIIAVLLFSIHWSVFVLILIAVIPGFWVRIKLSSELFQYSKANSQKEREGYYYNRILTGFAFAKELRLFGLKNFFISRFETIQDDIHKKKNSISYKWAIRDIISQIFAVILIFLSFGFVSFMAIKGMVTIGSVILFFLVFQRGYVVMKSVFQSLAGLTEDNVFFQNFKDFMDFPSSKKLPVANSINDFPQKGITIHNVSFKYPSSQRNALNSVSIDIPKGKTIALVGANGSGKTTLIKLICGFYHPQNGKILFDDTDISLVDSDVLRKNITVVFQDFALYNLTASENISLGDISKPVSEIEIKKAAQNAGIDDVLENLPLSYNTMLGNLFEKGEELSIGQWQKMALAKAFYRNSPLLLLDEPSSALDVETENLLLQNIRSLAQDKTVVIVSHRFSTVKWADFIYVLDKGEVIESGTHQHLMSLKGRYYEMYSSVNQ